MLAGVELKDTGRVGRTGVEPAGAVNAVEIYTAETETVLEAEESTEVMMVVE